MDGLYFNGPDWATNDKLTEDMSRLTDGPYCAPGVSVA